MSANTCKCAVANASASAVTVEYARFSPLLEAGYGASLTPNGNETAHFTVLKTHGDVDAAARFVTPFMTSWRRRHPCRQPTLVLVSINPHACTEALVDADPVFAPLTLCRTILDTMSAAANNAGLAALGQTYACSMRPTTCPARMHMALHIPPSYIILGVIGFI